MRKLTMGLCVAVAMVLCWMGLAMAEGVGGTLKFGFDMEGDHELSALGMDVSTDVENGFSLSAELLGQAAEHLDIGLGVTYQIPRELEQNQGEFNFIPVYAVARIRANNEQIDPYVTGQIGYNF